MADDTSHSQGPEEEPDLEETKGVDLGPPPTHGETGAREASVSGERHPIKRVLKVLGPGVIAGASDADPATIATCAHVGAAFGYAMLWTMVITIPLMAALQYMTAKIGQVSGLGLGGVLRKHYPRALLYPMLLALIAANSINAGADLGAMAAALNLLVPIPIPAMILPIACVILALQFWGTYRMIERMFRLFTLAILAYVVAAVLARPNWSEVFRGTLIPTIRFDHEFLQGLVAIIGTTFSPYLYFWQAGQEVEEKVAMGRRHYRRRRGTTDEELRYTAWDINTGMVATNAAVYFVILASAATLFTAGQHEVQTAEQLADALRPLAGRWSSVLLTIGLLGTGFIAIPVLTTSAAYAVAEAFGWRRGLDSALPRAQAFYGIILLSTLIGLELNYAGISPISALYWTSIIYGFLSPILLAVILLLANNREVMDQRANPRWLNILGIIAVLLSAAAAIGMLLT